MSGWALAVFILCVQPPGQAEPSCTQHPWMGDEAPPTLDSKEQCKLHTRQTGLMVMGEMGLPTGTKWKVRGMCIRLDDEGRPIGGDAVKGTSA